MHKYAVIHVVVAIDSHCCGCFAVAVAVVAVAWCVNVSAAVALAVAVVSVVAVSTYIFHHSSTLLSLFIPGGSG